MAIKNRGQTRSLKHRIGFAALAFVLLGGIFAPVTQEVSAAVIIKNTPDGNQVNSKSLPTINNNWTISNPISGGTKEVATTNDATSSSKSTSSSKKATTDSDVKKVIKEAKTAPKLSDLEKDPKAMVYGTYGTAGWQYSTTNKTLTFTTNGSATALGSGGWKTASTTVTMDSIRAEVTTIEFASGIKLTLSGDAQGIFSNFPKVTALNNFGPGVDVSAATDFGTMFANLPLLKTFVADEWNTSTVHSFGNMFAGDTALTTVSIKNWNSRNLTWAAGMFKDSPLANLTVGADFYITSSPNRQNMFKFYTDYSGSITVNYNGVERKLSGFYTWGIIGNVFYDIETGGDLHLKFGGTLPKTNGSGDLFQIADNGVRALVKKVTLEAKISTDADARSIFMNFANLETFVNGSNFDLSKATTIEHLFMYDGSLTTIDVSDWETGTITDMGGAFQLTKVKELNVSTWDVSKVKNFWDTFYDVQSEVMDFSNWKTLSSANITHMISHMPNLKKVYFGKGFNLKVVMPNIADAKDSNGNTADGDRQDPDDYWFQARGTGSLNAPTGLKLDSSKNWTYDGSTADVYVLHGEEFNDMISYWNPSESANPAQNTGAYGSLGYYDKVNKADPWVDQVNEGDLTAADSVTVISNSNNEAAKGIFGNVQWYITSDGTLHLNKGTLSDPIKNTSGNVATPWWRFMGLVKKVQVDGGIVTFATDSTRLFSFDGNLTDVITDSAGGKKFDASKATKFDSMFDSDSGLVNLDASYWDTSSMKSAVNMFYNVLKMTSLDITNWSTAQATNLMNLFINMNSLNQIKFGANFSTAGITTVGNLPFLPNVTNSPKLRWRQVTGGTRAVPSDMAAYGPFFRPDITANPQIDTNDLAATGTKHPVVADTYVLTNYTLSFTAHAVNESGNPVKGVPVQLVDKDGNVVASGVTDDNGQVVLPDVPIGDYTLRQDPNQNVNYYFQPDPVEVRVDNEESNSGTLTMIMQRTSTDQLPITGAKSTIAILSILLTALISYLGYSINKDRKAFRKQ